MKSLVLRLIGAFVLAGLLLGAAGAGRAAADSLSLSTSPSQPSDAVPVQIVASGSTSRPGVLHVGYRGAGTGNCATDPTVDPSSAISPDGTGLGMGAFGPLAGDAQTLAIGSYQLCGWLTDPNDETTVFATASATFSIVASDSLALASVPGAVEGQPFDLNATGVAYDSNAIIDVTYKPAAGACAASPDLDTGTVPDASGSSPHLGQYSQPVLSQQVLDAGGYLVCAWLVDQDDPVHPLAAASERLTVRPVRPAMRLLAPAHIDGGEAFTLTLSANVDWGVPLVAVADLKPKSKGARCAGTPAGEPTSAAQELNGTVTDTQRPSGLVSLTNDHVSAPGYGAYLVCAWLLNGWTTAENPPTVAGPISTTVIAVRPQIFRGRTSQHLPIKITLAPIEGLVLDLSYKDRLHCRGTPTFTNGLRWNGLWSADFGTSVFGKLRVGRGGSFRVNLKGNSSHTFRLSGRLKHKRITGTLSEQGKSAAFTANPAQALPCRTGNVRYTVH